MDTELKKNNSDLSRPTLSVNAPETSVSTGVLMSTLWSQSGVAKVGDNTTVKYNEYCPLDSGSHCVTGCTNTAAGQMIYYFIEKFGLELALTLNADDEFSRNISIKADGSTPGTVSFDVINEKLSEYDLNSADDAAALVYACGVVQEASYSKGSTGTAWSASLFTRAGFASANNLYVDNISYWGTKDENGKFRISDAGYEVIIDNLLAGKVVGASLSSVNHAVVFDGYDSENDLFHINYGWGNSNATRWYTREEIFEGQYYHFLLDLAIEKQEVITVSDCDVYGSGTLLRAAELAKGIAGHNTIVFDETLSEKSIKLSDYVKFSESVSVENFNTTCLMTAQYGFYTTSHDNFEFNDLIFSFVSFF